MGAAQLIFWVFIFLKKKTPPFLLPETVKRIPVKVNTDVSMCTKTSTIGLTLSGVGG